MSSLVKDLTAGIETTMANILGVGYSKLPYLIDVSKNNFNTNNNRYGVRVGTSTQAESVTRHITISQSFTMVITKAYIEDGISDSDSQTKQLELQDLVLDIYKEIYNTKAGVPSIFLNVNNLSVSDIEYSPESEYLVINASFNILYRFSL